jgi:hypothetical protein
MGQTRALLSVPYVRSLLRRVGVGGIVGRRRRRAWLRASPHTAYSHPMTCALTVRPPEARHDLHTITPYLDLPLQFGAAHLNV